MTSLAGPTVELSSRAVVIPQAVVTWEWADKMAEGTQNMNTRHGRGCACHQDWWRKGGLINRAVCLRWVTIMSVYNIPTHKVVPNN